MIIVCGPESAGNRLAAGILVASGLRGKGSTEQPREPALARHTHDVVVVHYPHATGWCAEYGDGTYVCMYRDRDANVASMVARGHVATAAEAEMRLAMHMDEITKILKGGYRVVFYPYELLWLTYQFCQTVGVLPCQAPIWVEGKVVDRITNENWKYRK